MPRLGRRSNWNTFVISRVSFKYGVFSLTRGSLWETLTKTPWKGLREEGEAVQEGQPPPQDENNMWAHCLVMWGNLLYEYSQILAAVEADWKPVLDKAVSNFRGAGCPEDDITAALRAHTQAAHLDLPPADAAAV